jgi:hypothetical protein
MSLKLPLIFLAALLVIPGCDKTTQLPANSSTSAGAASSPVAATAPSPAGTAAPTEAAPVSPKLNSCALLTSKEIEAVQGEPIKETKLTGQSGGGFSISQCYFALPTATNSVSLLVAQRGEGAGAHDPEEFWRDSFHKDQKKTKDKDHDRESDRDKKKGAEEEEETAPPQKIAGVGDEAYWTGTRVGGALYVLKGNAYARISVGGPGDQATKIKKSRALAQKVLARL